MIEAGAEVHERDVKKTGILGICIALCRLLHPQLGVDISRTRRERRCIVSCIHLKSTQKAMKHSEKYPKYL